MSGKSGAHAITINMSGKHAGTLVGTALAPRREKEEHDTHEDAVDDVMKGKTTAMVMMRRRCTAGYSCKCFQRADILRVL